MAVLPTDFLDDILAESMNGKRKFRITRSDGTFEEVIIEDVSEYLQTGSTFGAGDINRTNQTVNEKFDSGDVVDPMLTTEPGFAADAYQTKLQFDKQNKNCVIITTRQTDVSFASLGSFAKSAQIFFDVTIDDELHNYIKDYISKGYTIECKFIGQFCDYGNIYGYMYKDSTLNDGGKTFSIGLQATNLTSSTRTITGKLIYAVVAKK